jgi:hypothetical protein
MNQPTQRQIEAAALALANYDSAVLDLPLLASMDDFRFETDYADYIARAKAALTAALNIGGIFHSSF